MLNEYVDGTALLSQVSKACEQANDPLGLMVVVSTPTGNFHITEVVYEPERVENFAVRIVDPAASLAARPAARGNYIDVDGHHRALAYRKLDRPVRSWVTEIVYEEELAGALVIKTGPKLLYTRCNCGYSQEHGLSDFPH